jgi:hypothetical protein
VKAEKFIGFFFMHKGLLTDLSEKKSVSNKNKKEDREVTT